MRVCPFNGCGASINPAVFACRPHWFSLSKQDRDEVYAAYSEFREGKINGRELRRRQQAVLGDRGLAEPAAPQG